MSDAPGLLRASLPARGVRPAGAGCIVVGEVAQAHDGMAHAFIDAVADATGEFTPIGRRQDLPPAFHREGSVDVTRRDVVLEQSILYGRRLLGHTVDRSRSVDLDTPEDWSRTEALLAAAAPLAP